MTQHNQQDKIRDIVRKIHKAIPFFQENFERFCAMVEDYGAHVEICSKNPVLYVDIKKEEEIKKKRERLGKKYQEYVNQEIDFTTQIESSKEKRRELYKSRKSVLRSLEKTKNKLEALPKIIEPPQKGCIEYVYDAFMYINLPFLYPKQKRNKSHGRFWITPEYQNPTMWFNDIMVFSSFSKSQPIPKDIDKLLCNSVILAVVHDEPQEPDVTNSFVYRNKAYQGKYFNRNKFCRDLWGKLQDREDRIQFAYSDLKPSLDEWLEKNKTQGTTQEKPEQGNDGYTDSSNEKTSEGLFWKLYEKTIKALFDAILDKLNRR